MKIAPDGEPGSCVFSCDVSLDSVLGCSCSEEAFAETLVGSVSGAGALPTQAVSAKALADNKLKNLILILFSSFAKFCRLLTANYQSASIGTKALLLSKPSGKSQSSSLGMAAAFGWAGCAGCAGTATAAPSEVVPSAGALGAAPATLAESAVACRCVLQLHQ